MTRKIFFTVCWATSVLCLVAGYGIIGQWIGVGVALITAFAWLLALKYPGFWLPLICLLVSVCLAATGNLVGCTPLLMILSSGASLAVWDILSLDVSLKGNSFEEQTRQYQNTHLQSLALAIGSALVIALLGHSLHLQIPFLVWMFLVALATFGFLRAWGYLKKHHFRS